MHNLDKFNMIRRFMPLARMVIIAIVLIMAFYFR